MALSTTNAKMLIDGYLTPPKVKPVSPIQPPSVEAPPLATASAPRTGGPLIDGYLPPPPVSSAPTAPPPVAPAAPPAAPAPTAPTAPFTGAGDAVAGSSSSTPAATPAGEPTLDQIMALINSNPALAQTQLANEKAGKTAAGAEAAAVKNMLLGYGSQDLARQVLTKLAASDPRLASELGDINSFVGAKDAKGNALISDNPDSSTSILAQLARTYRDKGRATDENFNDNGNLFFSGARAGALNDLGYQQQVEGATQRGGLEDKLTAAALGLPTADSEGEQRYLDAYQNAYNAALQEAMQFGGLGGAPGGAGGAGGDGAAAPNIFSGANAQPDPFANLNNLSPADWSKIAALPVNQPAKKKTTAIAGGGGGRVAAAV